MENPLKISVACLSSECGKLEAQVPWTAFSDCKLNSCNSSHRKGTKMFNHTVFKCSDILRRKPRLILRDVLKTELGKDYIERIKMSKNNRRWSRSRKDSGRRKEEDVPCRETSSNQSDGRSNKSKNVTPKGKRRTSTSQRPTTRNRKPQNTEEGANEENQDIKEVIIGKVSEEKDETFAGVVDCGLSLCWEPAGDISASEEIAADLTGPEDMQHSLVCTSF
ncbi:uncharacterized protein LOC122839265 isoform X2 [Gambusia affinis]|nr:uncharacterized protein LOC122839265 isoform X2 [Gambusia affinis]